MHKTIKLSDHKERTKTKSAFSISTLLQLAQVARNKQRKLNPKCIQNCPVTKKERKHKGHFHLLLYFKQLPDLTKLARNTQLTRNALKTVRSQRKNENNRR